MNIASIVAGAFERARAAKVKASERGALHAERASAWVEALCEQFRRCFQDEPDVRVFSKHYYGNRADFGLNELLYDIAVCRVGTVTSSANKRTLLYVREALWQVESEFARDGRQAVKDFNKLVLGSAANKLFVGPQVHDCQRFLDVIAPAAKCCTGNVYAALVPHPDSWDSNPPKSPAWRFEEGGWISIGEK